MKITKSYLKQIIKEEINKLQNKILKEYEYFPYAGEHSPWDGYVAPKPPEPPPDPKFLSPEEKVKKELEEKIRHFRLNEKDLALIKAHGLEEWAKKLKIEVEKTREYEERMDLFGG